MADGSRPAFFAEVDLNHDDAARRALLIRPAVRLQQGHRYAVVVTSSVKDGAGNELPRPEGFRALMAGRTLEHPLWTRVASRHAEVMAAKAEDGKGAKVLGKFVRCTDAEQLNLVVPKLGDIGLIAACLPMPENAKDSLVWKGKLPAAGMKVALSIKKHVLFGKLDSAWK